MTTQKLQAPFSGNMRNATLLLGIGLPQQEQPTTTGMSTMPPVAGIGIP